MTSVNNAKKKFIIIWALIIVLLLISIFAVSGNAPEKSESIQEVMRDGVLHDLNKINLFGLSVNPALISAYIVTALLIVGAALFRIFAFPKFKLIPGKFQAAIEKAVEFFSDMAKGNSPHKPKFVSAYIFSAGVYIFFGTLFELLGVQAITDKGSAITLSAPLADVNAAIAMGVLSYGVILGGGIIANGLGGLKVLKDFSLPISMSFRLFGALLSGLLVTELVYYFVSLSFVLPVVVGVMFTMLHALIQTYVLTTLVSVFYGEAVEPSKKKSKKEGNKNEKD